MGICPFVVVVAVAITDEEAELPGKRYRYPGYPDDSANLSTFKRKTGYSGLVLASGRDSEWAYDGTPLTYAVLVVEINDLGNSATVHEAIWKRQMEKQSSVAAPCIVDAGP